VSASLLRLVPPLSGLFLAFSFTIMRLGKAWYIGFELIWWPDVGCFWRDQWWSETTNHKYFSSMKRSVVEASFYTIRVVENFSRGFNVVDWISFLIW
jgi:hypothetical protein